jgi:hypothetical protein
LLLHEKQIYPPLKKKEAIHAYISKNYLKKNNLITIFQHLFQNETNQLQPTSSGLHRNPMQTLSNISENIGSQRSTVLTIYLETLRALFNSFIRFLVKQSYLLSLLTMMVSWIQL